MKNDQSKDYAWNAKDDYLKHHTHKMEKLEQHKEFRLENEEFDPNIRERREKIPNRVVEGYFRGNQQYRNPESIYCAVQHEGRSYHLFEASRFPLGRMAVMIATIIRGKDKPGYHRG